MSNSARILLAALLVMAVGFVTLTKNNSDSKATVTAAAPEKEQLQAPPSQPTVVPNPVPEPVQEQINPVKQEEKKEPSVVETPQPETKSEPSQQEEKPSAASKVFDASNTVPFRQSAADALANMDAAAFNNKKPKDGDCARIYDGSATEFFAVNVDKGWTRVRTDASTGKPSKEESRMLLCTMESRKKVARDLPFRKSTAEELCHGGRVEPIAFAAHLHRAHHALHFLWSVASVVAAQKGMGIDHHSHIPTFIALGGYQIKYLEQFQRTQHKELLRLISPHKMSLYLDVQKHYLVPWMTEKGNDTSATSSTDVEPWYTGEEARHPRCFKRLFWGAYPVRIPSAKTVVTNETFQEMRRRAIEVFQLKETPTEQYILLIKRGGRVRRILNHDALATKIRDAFRKNSDGPSLPVVEVQWEGMTLREMLQLSINARAMVGTHGNGFSWACFMPLGSVMVEYSSNWRGEKIPDPTMAPLSPSATPEEKKKARDWYDASVKGMDLARKLIKRNDVRPGHQAANSANLATPYGMKSLTMVVPYQHNDVSKNSGWTKRWKYVDLILSESDIDNGVEFLQKNLR